MTTTRRNFLKSVAGGALATGVVRVAPAAAQAMTPVKVGLVVLADLGIAAPTLVALEKGFFKQNGIAA